jgi:hypothetical protein
MRVRVNSIYTYAPVMIDVINPPIGVERGMLEIGQRVRVVNKHGCPKANVMGHCYIESMIGSFLGLVHTNSLVKG